MLIEAGRLRLHISPWFALFFAVTANTLAGKTYVLMMLCALLHEVMHIALLFLSGVENITLKFGIGGIGMKSDGFELLSYRRTILCTIIPPVLNIALGGICCFVFTLTGNIMLKEAGIINFVLGAGNILPFSFLDGGRALEAALSIFYPPHRVWAVCDIVSVVTLVAQGCVFFMLFITGRTYLSCVFFFFYCVSGYISGKHGR